MSLLYIQKDKILKMENRKGNFEKFQNSKFLKDLLSIVIIFLSTYRKQSKRIDKTETTR